MHIHSCWCWCWCCWCPVWKLGDGGGGGDDDDSADGICVGMDSQHIKMDVQQPASQPASFVLLLPPRYVLLPSLVTAWCCRGQKSPSASTLGHKNTITFTATAMVKIVPSPLPGVTFSLWLSFTPDQNYFSFLWLWVNFNSQTISSAT